ncbi:oligosaccharide flippase family protein [Enterococcus sp. DIV0756]|uniref:oligosaccharide flippase family protein n=1 Tax=Enterococcus sp. DIV0756 TaxID=2774636 RepID=UPI003F1F83BC
MKNKLVTGTFWLSLSNIVCKVLGFVYLIPWLIFMGNTQDQQSAQALYNVAYLPYALFLSLGTAGFPSGIAKKIAELNAKGNQNKVRELFQSGLAVMEIIGIISAVLMFIFAPALSRISPIVDHGAGTTAMRSLCLSLLLIPILSAMRGYFQGLNMSVPFGVSQVIEQVVRVIIILAGTYFIRIVSNGSILSAVVISTFASCIGGLFAIFHLLWSGKKKDLFRLQDFIAPPFNLVRRTKNVAKEIIRESLPFVFVGAVISILQLIDQFSIKSIFSVVFPAMGSASLQTLYTLASANPNKLAPILLALISSVTITSLPMLSVVWTKGERQSSIADILRLTLTFLIPSSIGMLILCVPLNTVFFGYNLNASIYLAVTIVSTFFLGILSVLLSILQSLNAHKKAVSFTCQLILLKLLLQVPCIYLFEGIGLSVATTVSTIGVIIAIYRYIVYEFDIHPIAYTRNYYEKVFQATFIMSVISFLLFKTMSSLFGLETRFQSIIVIAVIGFVGCTVFAVTLFGKKIIRKARTLL